MVPRDELEDDHKHSNFRRVLVAGVAVLAVAALTFGLLRPATPEETDAGAAPSFELAYLGRPGTLSSDDLRGKPVVLNLWASWCIPCREEVPALEAMWKKYKDDVTIVGINVRDSKAAAQDFAEEFGITYPLVRDEDRSVEKALGAYGLPETFFIDHRWRFAAVAQRNGSGAGRGHVYLGGISVEELEANIEALLARAEDDA